MSRRYGRKQRRAARETIAEHEKTIWHARQALLREDIRTGVQVGSDRPDASAYYSLSYKAWHDMKRDGPNSPGLQRFIHRIAGDLVRLLAAPSKHKQSGDDLFPPPSRARHAERR